VYSGYSAIQVDIQGALCGLKSKTIVGENSPWSQGKCINENGGDGKKKTDGAAAERRNRSSKRQQAAEKATDCRAFVLDKETDVGPTSDDKEGCVLGCCGGGCKERATICIVVATWR